MRFYCGFRIAECGLNRMKKQQRRRTASHFPGLITIVAIGLPFGDVAVSSFSSFSSSSQFAIPKSQ